MLYISVYIERESIITHLRSHFGLSGGSSSITGGVLHRGSSTQGALRALGIIMLDLSNEELLQAPRVLSVPSCESLRNWDFEGQSAQGRRQHLPLPSTMSGTTPPPRKVARQTRLPFGHETNRAPQCTDRPEVKPPLTLHIGGSVVHIGGSPLTLHIGGTQLALHIGGSVVHASHHMMYQPNLGLWYCRRCGYYGALRIRKLQQRCEVLPSRSGRQNLSEIEGKPPRWPSSSLGPPETRLQAQWLPAADGRAVS